MSRNGPLTREDDTIFRESEVQKSGRSLAYFLLTKRLSFRLAEYKFSSLNLSDEAFRSHKYEKGQPDDIVPADADRLEYNLNGNLRIEPKRMLGFISPEGTEYYRGPIYLGVHTRSKVSDRGTLWFYERDEYNDREGIYVSVYVSEARMRWLSEEMRHRPHAEVHVTVEAKVFQHEVDNALAEPDQFQDYYIERDKRHEIEGATFMVSERELPAWKAPDDVDHRHYEDAPAAPVAAGSQPTGQIVLSEQLLRRLIRGVGWVIGLLVAILLAVLVTGG